MRLEYVDGGSAKFWEGERSGTTVTVRWGRIGTAGQVKDKDFADDTAAQAFLDKQVAEKQRKGYSAADAPVRPLEPVAEVQQAEPEPQPADEDTFVLSPGLAKQVLPRRDRDPAKRRPDPKAESAYDECLIKYLPGIRAGLTSPDTDPALRSAGERYLQGDPDPLGAAAVAAGIGTVLGWRSSEVMGVVGAGWIARHGVVFAAAACADLAAIVPSARSGRTNLRLRGPDENLGWSWMGEHAAVKVRSALATADDHPAAVAALAERRARRTQRVVAAFLVPTETAWVDEACAEAAGNHSRSGDTCLLLSAVSTLDQYARIAPITTVWELERIPRTLPTLVASVGPAIAPALAEFVQLGSAEFTRKLLGVLGELPTDEAFDLLLDRIDQKYVQPALLEAMKRFPRRAARLLAARTDATAQSLLRAHILSHPELVAELPADVAARTVTERLPDAPDDALPDVLVSPPWTRPRTKDAPVEIALPVPAGAEVRWAPGEHDRCAALIGRYRYDPKGKPWPHLLDVASRDQLAPYHAVGVLLAAPDDLARQALARWRPTSSWDLETWGAALLARFGTEAVPALVSAVTHSPAPTTAAVLAPVFDASTAALMADFLVRLKGVRKQAIAWFGRHGVDAVPLLAPAALGPAGKERKAAEAAIRLIARTSGDDAVLAAVPEQATAGIAALLARDPLADLPARMPKIGEWADPALLPQVRVRGGEHALPLTAVGHLLTMLALGKPGEPYPGVELVKQACESTGPFAWGLFQRWQAAGYPAKDSWVMSALGVLGDDDTVRALAPLIRAWPGEGGHQRAVTGLDVLTDIGTDVALMHLNGIAQKVKYTGLKSHAREKIAQLAADLGLSSDQLADRLVPDFGLSADGSMVLDYGSRKFTVGFDEQLKPFVSDVDGPRRKALPKPSAKDDPDLATAAYERFSALKKDVKAVAADQIRRLELAMVAQRRWSAQEFTELFVEHPLLWHVVRRLVWAVYTDDGVEGFRVAEDRTFADADDETFTLPEDAVVGVAHPLHLADALPAWAEVFADYEILQPFPQLGRPVHALTDAERADTELTRFDGAKASTGRVLTLIRRGWQRGAPQDAGVEPWMLKPLPDGRVVVAHLDPGIVVGEVMAFPEQKLEAVRIDNASVGYYWRSTRSTETFATLDPVTESELIADLTEVFAP